MPLERTTPAVAVGHVWCHGDQQFLDLVEHEAPLPGVSNEFQPGQGIPGGRAGSWHRFVGKQQPQGIFFHPREVSTWSPMNGRVGKWLEPTCPEPPGPLQRGIVMRYLDKLFFLMLGLFFPALAFAQAAGRVENGMMDGWMTSGMGIMGIFMMIIWLLLIVLLVLAILALIKYLRGK